MSIYKKIFISIILFVTFFNSDSFAEVVNTVDIKGNQRISSETIMIFGDVSIGKNYETVDINLLIKKL